VKVIDLKNIPGIVEVNGSYSDKEVVLTTDSRSITGENVFLALKGENFDGFSYLTKALEQGVEVVIYTSEQGRSEIVKSMKGNYPQVLFIAVNDTLKYLQDSASYWVRKWQKNLGGKVLALTGSNGKTTTKELLFTLAEKLLGDKVMCTGGNFNNHIGVPLTIFKIKECHSFAIIEMGTNHPGEIEALCNIANPDFGLITNIGAAHLEFFKDEKGVLLEKGALYRYINANSGRFYLNQADPNLVTLDINEATVTFGREPKEFFPDLTNEFISESYNLWNLKTALFTLSDIFPQDKDELLKSSENIKLPDNKRSQWIKKNGKEIFLDAYNANPTSMMSALRSFSEKYAEQQDNALYVLGDMNELGDLAQKFHEEVAEFMNDLGIENAIFVGRYAHFYGNKFNGRFEVFVKREDLDSKWHNVLNSYQYIFLKASRSLQLESLIDITV